MREKLIELLREVQYLGGLEEKIADHLIANGVTIQKWIPVSERLPDEYLVETKDGSWKQSNDVLVVVRYSWRDIEVDRTCNGRWEENDSIVTHWMPLPEPPKGEQNELP